MSNDADEMRTKREMAPGLKFAVEFGPLVVFFAVYSFYGIFAATAVFMVTSVAALIVSYVLTRHVAPMPLFTAVIVLVFGGLTIYLQDETFIKLKPTIINLLFAAILAGGLWLKRNPLRVLFAAAFNLSERGWYLLTLRWVFFFIAMAIANEFVWRTFSTDFWVNYKVFGILPLTFIFAIAQAPLLQKHAIEDRKQPLRSD